MNSLRLYRVKARFTEEEFAGLLDISIDALCKYEKDIQSIQLSVLQSASHILDKSTDELLADPLANIVSMGERIRIVRELSGYSIRRLSASIDITPKTLLKLESSSYIEDMKIVEKIALSLNLPINLLRTPESILLDKALTCLVKVLPKRMLNIYSGEDDRSKVIRMLIDYKD